MKQTAVEFLLEKQNSQMGMLLKSDFIKAKEMEKQQQDYSEEDMTEAFRVGFNIGCNDVESPYYLIFEEWFKNGLKKIKNK
jgi:hypothetical protein